MSHEIVLAPMAAPELKALTYAPFDWATHPIDTTPQQNQGWGPFSGAPYTPFDYPDKAMSMGGANPVNGMAGINQYWTQGSNAEEFAPPGAANVSQIYTDNSTSFVNNMNDIVSLAQKALTGGNTSTISNGNTVMAAPASSQGSVWHTLKKALGI